MVTLANYAANVIGVILMALVLCSNRVAVKSRKTEYIYMEIIAACILSGNLFEMLGVLCDGRIFYGARMLNYIFNMITFLSNLLFCFVWLIYVDYWMWRDKESLKKKYKYFAIITAVVAALVVTTGFHGLIFHISSDNLYERGKFFYLVAAYEMALLFYSVGFCHWSKRKMGSYIYFPIVLYLSPIVLGTALQGVFYGLLVGWAATSLAVTGIYISLQQGMAYQDPLTGLLNRNYLNVVLATIQRDNKIPYGGIMLDIDDFKKINDNLGHLVGDKAITKAGEIIKKSLKPGNMAIRYAGDEFVVLIKNADRKILDETMENIKKSADDFNNLPDIEYKIIFSMGSSMFYTDETSADRFLHDMDVKMYENKKDHKRIAMSKSL